MPEHLSSNYLPRPSSGEPSSSNSRKGLQAMTVRSEEAHHEAEFHMGRGESYVTMGSCSSLTAPSATHHLGCQKESGWPLKNSSIWDVQTADEHHWACISSVSTQNPPALQFRPIDNKCNKSPVWYAQPRGAATAIYSASIHLWGQFNRSVCY